MKQYYTNSEATIVFGLHFDTFASRWSKVAPVLDTWAQDRAAKSASTRRAVWEGLGDIDNVVHQDHDLWFWRVWTLQEAVIPTVFTRRLITSDGTQMNLPVLCDLIDWTYAALGTKALDTSCGDAQYDWIHPGAGVVNDRGWWIVSDNLKAAMSYREHPIHPLQLLNITRFRHCFRPVDRLRGAYGIMDESWHIDPIEAEKEANKGVLLSSKGDVNEGVLSNPNTSLWFRIRNFLTKHLGCFGHEESSNNEVAGRDERERRLFEITWEKTVDKYIEREEPDCAPLLTMRVTDVQKRTWGIGEVQTDSWVETHKIGSVTAEFGKWINRTAQLVYEGPLKGSLRLRASGVDRIKEVKCNDAYGDGSGELFKILKTLNSLVEEDYDISSILTILQRAVDSSQRHEGEEEVAGSDTERVDGDTPKEVLKKLESVIRQNANAVSSGLRAVFNGWDRWIVSTEDRRAYLVWFPWRQDPNQRDRLSNCSLIWPSPGHNEWAFIGEGGVEQGYKKVGIAFVDSTHPGPETPIVVL
ncbi:hypothetical protein FRC17_006693 [Serendipita sp. 399]|nr:hypothetical protein FRC17_006693 [Serendipita sp. 399]